MYQSSISGGQFPSGNVHNEIIAGTVGTYMKNTILLLFLNIIPISGFAQNLEDKDFVILTFEMDRNKDSHGTFIYYWVAELEEYRNFQPNDRYKKVSLYSIFLHEFYGSEQLDSCCLGEVSYPYTYTTATEFKFPENHSKYLTDLRELVEENRQKIQVIKKEWRDGYKEKVTVYATAVRGKLCECEFGGDRFLTKGDRISFPKGNYEVLKDFFTLDKRILLFKDFSDFEYSNTDYRTGK
jgi:hypothetical protein